MLKMLHYRGGPLDGRLTPLHAPGGTSYFQDMTGWLVVPPMGYNFLYRNHPRYKELYVLHDDEFNVEERVHHYFYEYVWRDGVRLLWRGGEEWPYSDPRVTPEGRRGTAYHALRHPLKANTP